MSIASYPWNSTAEIRAHYAKLREECHARYERQSVQINREERDALTLHRQIVETVEQN
jgi:hypothetical protein